MKSNFALILGSLAAMTMTTHSFADGQVNFKGTIVNAACNINVDGSANGDVDLGKWPTSTFKAVGDKSIPQPFKLNVTDCTSGNYKFNFTGTADATNANLLKASVATGVGIAIANADSLTNYVKINTTASGTTGDSNANISIASGATTANLPLQAYYQATNASVTAGEANSTVRVTLTQK